VELVTGSTLFEKTPEEHRRDAYANLEYSILEEQKKQDDIIKRNKNNTIMGFFSRGLRDINNKPTNEVKWFLVIIVIEFIFAQIIHPENGLLQKILIFVYLIIPYIYIVFSMGPAWKMDRVANEEIERAREKKLKAREICTKRVEEDCEAYEKRYNEWIEATQSADNSIMVIYTNHNQIGDIIHDSSNNIFNIIDTRKIDYDKLVDQIYSNEEGLKELINQIEKLEQGKGNLSRTLKAEKEKTRKDTIKEMLGNVANVATVVHAVTGIGNIPQLAGYVLGIIKLLFA